MGMRFRLAVIGVLGLAVVIGIIAGRSQPPSSAAGAPTLIPTPIPAPLPNHVDVIPRSGDPPARFNAPVLTVHVGQTVTWVNHTDIDHTATANNGAFNSDVLSPGQAFRWTPRRPGHYTYACFIHPGMQGVIVVNP